MFEHHQFARSLVAAFRTGEWTAAALTEAGNRVVVRKPKWMANLAERIAAAFPRTPSFTQLLTFLECDREFQRIVFRIDWSKYRDGKLHARWRSRSKPLTMADPPASMGTLAIPALPTEVALADWLGITPRRLRWYADITGRNRRHPPGPLRTYQYRWVAKPGGKSRLLEIPTGGLKLLQRTILAGILNAIPVHSAAHGFCPGRSIVSNAIPHCGKRFVLRFDLTDFFPSIPTPRIVRIFRTVGYPEIVARLLAGLCTTCLPLDVWNAKPNSPRDGSDHAEWQRFASRHLPQGAPTSPAIANLAAFRLDRRLHHLALKLGADYTRYADDLTFSGDEGLARGAKRLTHLVAVIAGEEGFTLNFHKTHAMRSGERQRVAGLIVNMRPNVSREDYDVLKAILTNCIRHGPASQNRDQHPDFRAHLAGKVSHAAMVNPNRGRKLWLMFDRISWVAAPS